MLELCNAEVLGRPWDPPVTYIGVYPFLQRDRVTVSASVQDFRRLNLVRLNRLKPCRIEREVHSYQTHLNYWLWLS